MMIYDKLSGLAFERKDSSSKNVMITRDKEDSTKVCKALLIIKEADKLKQRA